MMTNFSFLNALFLLYFTDPFAFIQYFFFAWVIDVS